MFRCSNRRAMKIPSTSLRATQMWLEFSSPSSMFSPPWPVWLYWTGEWGWQSRCSVPSWCYCLHRCVPGSLSWQLLWELLVLQPCCLLALFACCGALICSGIAAKLDDRLALHEFNETLWSDSEVSTYCPASRLKRVQTIVIVSLLTLILLIFFLSILIWCS